MKKYYIAPDIFFEQIETNGIMDINTSGGVSLDSGITEEQNGGSTTTTTPSVNEPPGDGTDLAKDHAFWGDIFEGE